MRLIGTNELACVLFTGYQNPSGERYIWGIRRTDKDTAVVISDGDSAAVSGSALGVQIDNTLIGTYTITKRRTFGGMTSVAAHLSEAETSRLMTLLRLGGTVRLTTNSSTYAAPLAGARQGTAYLGDCVTEMMSLGGMQNQ